MKKIKYAKSISDLIVTISKQALKEPCHIGVVFSNSADVKKLLTSGLVTDLPWQNWSNNMLRVRFQHDTSSCSTIEFFAIDIPRMHGKRFDYILMDSRLTDDEKLVLKCTTFRGCGFLVGDKSKLRTHKDKRKNIIQEFTLAEEWPLLT